MKWPPIHVLIENESINQNEATKFDMYRKFAVMASLSMQKKV